MFKKIGNFLNTVAQLIKSIWSKCKKVVEFVVLNEEKIKEGVKTVFELFQILLQILAFFESVAGAFKGMGKAPSPV